MPMETRHDLEHTTERLTEGLRCPWKWGQCVSKVQPILYSGDSELRNGKNGAIDPHHR